MRDPLFSVLGALHGVVSQIEPKDRGVGASTWFSMREITSELAGSQQVDKVSDDIGCAS